MRTFSLKKFQFGFHVGGTDENGVSRDVPEGSEVVLGPDGEDGLPDSEYLISPPRESLSWDDRKRIALMINRIDDLVGYDTTIFITLEQ